MTPEREWVGSRESTPVLSKEQLHRIGDVYGGWRLPEDNVVLTDDKGMKHNLHIIGRWVQCRDHLTDATYGMAGFKREGENIGCIEIAKTWADSFRPGVKYIPFMAKAPTTITDHALLAMRRIIQATIYKRIRTHTVADIHTLDRATALFPELFRNPDWLQGHAEAGVDALSWGVLRKLETPAEMNLWSVIARPEVAPLIRLVTSELEAASDDAARKEIWKTARSVAERVYELRDQFNQRLLIPALPGGHNLTTLDSVLRGDVKATRDVLLSYALSAQRTHKAPAKVPPRWLQQGVLTEGHAQLAAAFSAVAPDLSDALIAYMATAWTPDAAQRLATHRDRLLQAMQAQELGYGACTQDAKLTTLFSTGKLNPLNPPWSDDIDSLAMPPDWVDDVDAGQPDLGM